MKTALGANPWFIQQIVIQESRYLQFNASTGLPLFGPPNGFGIMQLDPPNNSVDVWYWPQNITDGKALLATKGTSANTWWAQQVYAFNQWNSDPNKPRASPPPDDQEGKCVFSYTPTGASHPFSDAVWIKKYNGAPKGEDYISFVTSTSAPWTWAWMFNKTNHQGVNYVLGVCNQVP